MRVRELEGVGDDVTVGVGEGLSCNRKIVPVVLSVVNHKLPSAAMAGENETCAFAVYTHITANVENDSA